MESEATSVAPAESQSGTKSASRLVIRVKIIPDEPPQAPVRRLSRNALLLILGAVAVLLLSWVGIGMFRSDPTNSQSQSPTPVPAPREAAPVVSDEPVPKPATATAETIPAEAKPVESAVREQPGAPPLPLNQVIPDVSQSARETIRGTIIVSIRVIVGKDGTVLAATADDPGPSRYFERLAVEASKKWTFTPAKREQRAMLVRFYFTRAGTTARATPL